MTAGSEQILHASCVAVSGRAALVLGASGSGKSALALELMALGATLVADDRTRLQLIRGIPHASAPDSIRGMIEARGVGLLRAEMLENAPVTLVVDLDRNERDRLPHNHEIRLLGCALPLLHKSEYGHFPAAIMQYLKGGTAS